MNIIWDLDGTLLNSSHEISKTVEKALKKVNLSIRLADYPFSIGPPLKTALRNSFSNEKLPEEKLEMVLKQFRDLYDSSNYAETKVFPNIRKILKNNKHRHFIVTNKPLLATIRILEAKKIKELFTEIVCPGEFDQASAFKINSFNMISAKYPKQKFIGIGDMASDVQAAKSNGIPSIGVLWGYGTREELKNAGCDFICETVDDLIELLDHSY